MSKIHLGLSDGKAVHIDLNLLITTRLLIQANSGGGKSWLLRRIIEQAFGKVQIIVVDPEGEFASLREKFDFVLVGQGGETPADIRSAALVAHKLLELNASAVCDLYEMKPKDRHTWVRLFLESLIDAPKSLWHPVLVIVDEAHIFVPEKGHGASEASEAMIAFSTRGRKRGFCAVWATQRLAKIQKDATSELFNRLIGPTFEDVDLERAAGLLSITNAEKRKFYEEMRVLEPGNFYAFGRAVSKKRIMVQVGDVSTTHPEVGWSKHKKQFSAAPPTPEKIKSLLPQLSDLPQVAQEKARTESELRSEVNRLQRELVARPVQIESKTQIMEVKVPVMLEGQISEIQNLIGEMQGMKNQLGIAEASITKSLEEARNLSRKAPPVLPIPRTVVQQRGFSGPTITSKQNMDDISGPEQRILGAIAWFESIGQSHPRQTAVAFLAGYTFGGGAFNNPRGALRTKGLIEYHGNAMALTKAGRTYAAPPHMPLTQEEMQEHVMRILPGPERKILSILIQYYPNAVSKSDLAQLSGYAEGGAFNNPLGRLRTIGLIEYPAPKQAMAMPFLFLQ